MKVRRNHQLRSGPRELLQVMMDVELIRTIKRVADARRITRSKLVEDALREVAKMWATK